MCDGLDFYVVGLVGNFNVLLDDVSLIWMIIIVFYGFVFILVVKFVMVIVGNNVVVGIMLLCLCMLFGLVLLVWVILCLVSYFGIYGLIVLWICVLNLLVFIYLMGGVYNEMLMVGLMIVGIVLIV